MFDKLFLRINFIQNSISIVLVTGCKSDDFVVFGHLLQKADGIRPYTNISDTLAAVFQLHRQSDIIRLGTILPAVKQSLVDINQQSLLILVALLLAQIHLVLLYAREGGSLYFVLVSQYFER